MTPQFKLRPFLGMLVLAVTQLSRADAPDGFVSFSFTAEDVPLWDLTGSYQLDQTMVGSGTNGVPLSFGIDLAQDPRGFLTGSGTTIVAVGDDYIAADYTVKGRISGGGTNLHVSVQVRLSGEDVVRGVQTPFNITIVYTFQRNTDSGQFLGKAQGSAHFDKLGSGKIHSSVPVTLPGDGSWTLQMNVVPLNRLGGSAQIILSNGRTLQTHLSGSYSSSSDRSSVKVNGFDDSRGNSASVVFDSSELLQLRGTIFGQSVRR